MMAAVNDVDAYGLPTGILGRHPEEFYGVMGRVVCVCAVLEDQVTTLRHTLACVQQGMYTHQPISKQIETARSLSQDMPDWAAHVVTVFLDEVQAAFCLRNNLVHSSFPAQPDGRLWGHRPTRDRTVTDGSADTVETSIDELRRFLQHLVGLVTEFNNVHGVANTQRPAGS